MHLIANSDLARALGAVQARVPDASAAAWVRAIGDAATDMLADGLGRMTAPVWLKELVGRATVRVQTQAESA
jgi:hypothetical protein